MELLVNTLATFVIQGVLIAVFYLIAMLEKMNYPRYLFLNDRQLDLRQTALFVLLVSVSIVGFLITYASDSFIVADYKGRFVALGISFLIAFYIGKLAKDLGRSQVLWIFLSMFFSFPAAFFALIYSKTPVSIIDAYAQEYSNLCKVFTKKLSALNELKRKSLIDSDEYSNKEYMLKEEFDQELYKLISKQDDHIEKLIN